MLYLFESGEWEGFKGFYHGAIGVLAFGAAAYNAIAYARRGESHLAVNAFAYAALTAIEAQHVKHHRRVK